MGSLGLFKNELSRCFVFSCQTRYTKPVSEQQKSKIIAHQMSIRTPQAHYLRISPELSVENGAIQDPSASRGTSQPQLWDPRLKLILRWLVTLAFAFSLYGILHNFERKGNFPPNSKRLFTFLTTVLFLGLALNLLVSRSSAPNAACGY